MTRREALTAIRAAFPSAPFTTADLARVAGGRERDARGAVGWMLHHGTIEPVGRIVRRDRSGNPYQAKCYRWTGRGLPGESGSQQALAATWISARWR